MRVGHAEALAAIEGDGAGRRAAATQAVKALADVLRAYPAHPRRGSLELARALALQRAGKQSEAIAALRRVAIEQTRRARGRIGRADARRSRSAAALVGGGAARARERGPASPALRRLAGDPRRAAA